MKNLILLFVTMICFVGCAQDSAGPVSLDKHVISGIGLEKITPKWASPERKLFTKRIYNGEDLGINVTSSSNAFHDWKNYVIDEFVFVLNGQAIVESVSGKKMTFSKGDFFIVPKGFTGRWTTEGAIGNFLEIAIFSKTRANEPNKQLLEPVSIDNNYISGMKAKDGSYLFEGAELMVTTRKEKNNKVKDIKSSGEDVIAYILNGSVTITSGNGNAVTYHVGDFYVLPKGFTGKIDYKAFDIYRELIVKAKK